MSVINKVLRDLDQRGAASTDAPVTSAHAALRAGTQSVTPVPRPTTSRSKLPMVVLGLVCLLALVVLVWWQSVGGAAAEPPAGPVAQTHANASAASSPAAAVPTPIPAASGAAPVPVATATAADTPPPAPLPVFRAESRLNLKGWTGSISEVPVAPASAPQVAKPPPPPPAAAPAPEPLPTAQRQQMAARDALVQAQSLWSSGARDAAIDVLQEAIAAAERHLAANTGAGSKPVLASLVREWARMLLAESRPAPVWELLTRLEAPLREDADLWAVRGNAAQRLGQHQDSVHAYLAALQFRPNEQRWMLGAAVSLAALGQTANAAAMAERAAAAGPFSRDVQTYLRQMGVPLKEK